MQNKVKNYPYLSYKKDELYIENHLAEDLIKNVETPFFLFLPERFKDNIKQLQKSLEKNLPNFFISYAMKANYLGRILEYTAKSGIGCEAMSLFELKLAEKAGFEWKKVIFNGPAKTVKELTYAITNGIRFLNVDSLNELELVNKLAEKNQIKQPITVRIHPELSEETEKRLLIRKNSKLGIDFSRGVKLYKYARDSNNLTPTGVHVHLGTNLTSLEFYKELLIFLNQYIKEIESKLEINISEVNLGGGLASRAIIEDSGFDLIKLGEQISNYVDDIENKTIIFEPGRFLVEDSIIALTKVLRTKKSWGRKWAFTDIGANSLIPMRYSQYKVIPTKDKGKDQYCRIGGPLCLPVDVITNESVDFQIEEEDFLAVLNCGAYTISMSEQFGYPRPATYELNEKGNLIEINPSDDLEKMIKEAFRY